MAASRYSPLSGTNSGHLAPAGNRGRWHVGSTPRRPLQAEDVELQTAMLERERRELRDELSEAVQVERRLSGPRYLLRQGMEIASEVFPVRWLAGDFVCAIDIGPHTWIALGDIGGKGLAAAMWFTHLLSLVRCHACQLDNPALVMQEINSHLSALQPGPPLVSMVLLVIGRQGELEYCNAGHPAPLVLRSSGSVERLESGGPLVGVLGGAAYRAGHVRLTSGDLLLGCTDGLLETCNAVGEEFGEQRLIQVMRARTADPAKALLFSLVGAVQDHAAGSPREDDLSLLLIRPTQPFSGDGSLPARTK